MKNKIYLLILKPLFACTFILNILFLNTGCQTKEQMQSEIENAVNSWRYSNSNFDEISVQEFSFPDGNDYCAVTCNASLSGNYYDVAATIGLEFYKEEGEWVLKGEPFYAHNEFTFHQMPNDFYYFSYRNTRLLFQIEQLYETKVDLNLYEYYDKGRGQWDHRTEKWDLSYNNDLQCFSFSYYGWPYRVYCDRVEEGVEEKNLAFNTSRWEYKKISPKDPNDYWWFRERWPNMVTTKDETTSNTVIVPNIITGQSFSSAKSLLEENGFIVVEVKETEPFYVEGSVLRAEPKSGTEVPYGSEILLYISAGNDLE